MRLFFFTIFIAASLPRISCITEYIPLPLYDRGEAFLLKDISPGERKALLRFVSLSQSSVLTAGTGMVRDIWIPAPEKSHYKGEMVSVRFETSGRSLSSLSYRGEYRDAPSGIRGSILDALEKVFQSLGESGQLLKALILGKKEGIATMAVLFRQAGVSHLLALSGLHISLVAAILYCVLRVILPSMLRGPAVLILLCFYAWLVGMNHSFIRAVLMFALVIFFRPFRIKLCSGKVILLSACLQIIIWSDCLGTWSFWLSYGAMAGIMLTGQAWTFILRKFLPDMLALPLAVSLAAQTTVLPMVITAFGWFQPAGIIAGLFLTPLIIVYLGAGLAALPVLLFFPATANIVRYPFQCLFQIMEYLALYFGRFPRCEWHAPVGKLLFFLCLSVIIGITILLIIKELQFVRKNSQVKL